MKDAGEPRALTAQELIAALVDKLPAPECVEPHAYLEDDLLPWPMAPVEPAAFALACLQAEWGPRGPLN